MRRYLTLVFLAVAMSTSVMTAPRSARADHKPMMVIGFNTLQDDRTQGQPALPIVLDVRPRVDYDAGHVEGAIWADMARAQAIAGRPGGMTDRDAWLDWIAPLRIWRGTQVWIIGDDRQLAAARMWWLLRYLGVENVGLVDGNFSLWKAQRRPMTREIPAFLGHIPPFPVDFQAERLATRDDVLAALKSGESRIVDARSAEEWVGKQVRAKRGGHIPDACRLEWSEFVDADGRFLSLAKLRAKVEAAGIKPGQSVIAHCQSGGRASVDAFVFEMLGFPTRNYYASWADWGNADDTPITTADNSIPTPVQSSPTGANLASKPFTVEYYYVCQWSRADEFFELFRRNHLPILRERMKQGDILKVDMTKPRIHAVEAGRWDYRVTIEFKDAASAFDAAGDQPIKERLFSDQKQYRLEEARRFAILIAHWDLPIEGVDLDKPVKAP